MTEQAPTCARCLAPMVRVTVETQPPAVVWLCPRCLAQPDEPRQAHRRRREAKPQ